MSGLGEDRAIEESGVRFPKSYFDLTCPQKKTKYEKNTPILSYIYT